jgi:Winged helix-turn helix
MGLDPAIHALKPGVWMPGSRPGMTHESSIGFRLIDSGLGGFTQACEADRLNRHDSGDLTHGDGLRAFERGGVGRTVCGMPGRHRVAASPRGHTISQVSETTAYGERWIEQLLARYNAEGPEALGDLRRRNGASATILKPDLLAKLRGRLREPPPMAGCGRAARWRTGWLANSASHRSRRSGDGKR